MLVLYREGLSPFWYLLGFGTAALVILGLVFEPPYIAAFIFMVVNFTLINNFKTRSRPWWIVYALLIPLSWWWEPVWDWFLQASKIDPAAFPDKKLYVIVPHILLFIAAFLPKAA